MPFFPRVTETHEGTDDNHYEKKRIPSPAHRLPHSGLSWTSWA
jgi:hypothetical protein